MRRRGSVALRLESALMVRYALCLTMLSLVVMAGGLFGVAGLLSEENDPAASAAVERELTYDGSAHLGPGDGEPAGGFGPGDGEPAVNFRLRCSPSEGEQADVGVLSVHLNDRYLYTVGVPRADAITPFAGDGIVLSITAKQAEIVLGRRLVDPDLPPVTVSCVLYNRLTMAPLDVVTWDGYLQGCWLEFPTLAQAEEAVDDEPRPVLKPTVDISSALGQAVPIDLRLEKSTIYYMLFASQDREAVLLHPENPEVYSRARVVSGGTFSWRPEEESTGSDSKANLTRLKYTPRADRTYLVLWALHRAVEDGDESTGADAAQAPAGDESPRVSGWTRSAVYELTNGTLEE